MKKTPTFAKATAGQAKFWTQITQIYADGMQGSIEPLLRGVPNAATLGDMESPMNKKQASLFFIMWVSHIAPSDPCRLCQSVCVYG